MNPDSVSAQVPDIVDGVRAYKDQALRTKNKKKKQVERRKKKLREKMTGRKVQQATRKIMKKRNQVKVENVANEV
ncbi:unnamed protein product [Leptidea sinapis]|uniref:Uncharacterized protein n=1 Tax=Leptidea sinapis TaxID=189913 RepID=A0A5E4R5B4_9NEOP|nr:unnamed protein product [Leptidea sinapis]